MDKKANQYLRGAKLAASLVGLTGLLIAFPAALFGVWTKWQIGWLLASYLYFFSGTVWRGIKYGNLAKRKDDEQVKTPSGRWSLVVFLLGTVSVHWLAIYEFSQLSKSRDDIAAIAFANFSIIYAITAILLTVSAIAINQVAIAQLGAYFDRLTVKPEQQLVTWGLYNSVRNPIYLSYILLFVGYCLVLGSLSSLLLLAITCIVWFGNRIKIEEEMLERQFGQEYRDYKQKTKRLLPLIY